MELSVWIIMCESFVIYKLPGDLRCVKVYPKGGRPDELYSYDDLEYADGFVLAPFEVSAEHPLLLFRTEKTCTFAPDENPDFAECSLKRPHIDTEREEYAVAFNKFHSLLEHGVCNKIVLARRSLYISDKAVSPLALFSRACSLYPEAFVMLVSAPQCGVWLAATPEVLVESRDGHCRTMALAGTVRRTQEMNDEKANTAKWDDKNIKEQTYVADYIAGILKETAFDINKSNRYVTNSGAVSHLTNNFSFRLMPGTTLGGLLQRLHPTPAVCGIPKAGTYDFICHNENRCREYYSGFSGPVNINGDANLYVTLRCMKITNNRYELYAGGGLVAESDEQTEWLETETKMETMRKCLATRKM